MAAPGSGLSPAIIIGALIIVFGIIHLGVGIGVVAKYRQYSDVYQQPVGLSAFNIVIGILALVTGIMCVIGISLGKVALSKIAAICSAVLAVFVIASLITALVLNSQAISFMRARLLYRMNTYIETDSSVGIMDTIQSHYQCCGVNLWLDWATVSLGTTQTQTGTGVTTGTGTSSGGVVSTGTSSSGVVGTGTSTGTSTGTVTGKDTGSDVSTDTDTDVSTDTDTDVSTDTDTDVSTGTDTDEETRRRRRHLKLVSSPLVNAIRQRRQVTTGGTVYNLPSTYSINLPLSCCRNGGITTGNTIGGYCVFSASNGTAAFYVQGCLSTIANIAVSQITGIAVINVCLAILAIILIPILMNTFPATFDPINSNSKQPIPNEMHQEQQVQNGGYYAYNTNPNAYYSYPQQQASYVMNQ